jgi:hypothetical protein
MEKFILTKIPIKVGIRFVFKRNIFMYRQYFGRLSRKELFQKENEELKLNGFESKNINLSH